MDISNKSTSCVLFKLIKGGQAFASNIEGSVLYMKVVGELHINAVNLHNGYGCLFKNDDKVIVIKAAVHIN